MSNLLSFVNSNKGCHGCDLIIVKGMFKIFNRLYDITCFGAVYA
jgi:hypothetical protein